MPTVGGSPCCNTEVVQWAAYDQRDIGMRADILCYTSAPIEHALKIASPVQLVLYAITDGRDTD